MTTVLRYSQIFSMPFPVFKLHKHFFPFRFLQILKNFSKKIKMKKKIKIYFLVCKKGKSGNRHAFINKSRLILQNAYFAYNCKVLYFVGWTL